MERGAIYEPAGDETFSMDELARKVSRQLGRAIAYRDLPEPEYQRALAHALADSDAGSARGELDDRSLLTLRSLLGRPTTRLRDAVASALAKVER